MLLSHPILSQFESMVGVMCKFQTAFGYLTTSWYFARLVFNVRSFGHNPGHTFFFPKLVKGAFDLQAKCYLYKGLNTNKKYI